jgi:chromosome segregation ATPase
MMTATQPDLLEGQSEQAAEPVESEGTRKPLSFGDRLKVVDLLRQAHEPFIADSKAAIAKLVSDASGIQISWAQLRYLIDDLEEYKLGDKIHVRTKDSPEARESLLTARIEAIQKQISDLSEQVTDLAETLAQVTIRVRRMEANLMEDAKQPGDRA